MRLYCDVTDASGNKLGDGPVQLTGVEVTRLLDGVGSVRVSIPGNDPRARTLLTALRRVNIYQVEEGEEPRLVAQGVITKRGKNENPSGRTLSIDGDDLLYELKGYNTLLAREYDNEPLADVVESLAGLAGWSAETEASDVVIVARYDGLSALKALQLLTSNNGLHLRLGESGRVVEVGEFGELLDLTLTNVDVSSARSSQIAIIETFRMIEQSEKIFNWLLPIGEGEGEAAITLANSTRPEVQSMTGPDGRTIYFLTNDASIAAYGMLQKTGQYKDIAPLTNSQASKVDAADTLCVAGLADLARNGEPQVTYSCTLRKVPVTLRPGDRVRIIYNPPRRDDGTEFDDRVDGEFYITKVTEQITTSESSVNLEISNINKRRQDAANAVMEAVERAEQTNLRPKRVQQTFVFHYTDHYSDLTNSTSIWEIPITTDLSEIISVKLRVRLIKPAFTGYIEFDGTDFWASYYFSRSLRYARCTIDIGYQPDLDTYSPTIERNLVTSAGSPTDGYYNEFDVTDDFLNSAGGLYSTHVIQFTGVVESVAVTQNIRIDSILPAVLVPPTPIDYATGEVKADLIITAIVQSLAPA